MNKITRLVLIIFSAVISLIIFISPSTMPIPKPMIAETKSMEIIATNLDNPRSITFGDKKIYIAEKNGKIKSIQLDTLVAKTLTSIHVHDTFNGGLLGLVTHPNYVKNHYIYAYFTYDDNNGMLWNKVIRITDNDDGHIEIMTIFDKIPGSKFNNGGVIKFGPDNKLYVATGIISNTSKSPQDVNSLEGKILRLNYDGTVPSDNPFSNSIFSYGHRNTQGMSWNLAGNFFTSELGDVQNDEINLIQAGQNYGWPMQKCFSNEDAHFIPPLRCYDPGIEPGGILTYENEIGSNLIISSLRNGSLYNLKIDQNELHSQQIILSGIGRIRDVGIGYDDYIYMITSNTDGKGFPSRDDDKLIRLKK